MPTFPVKQCTFWTISKFQSHNFRTEHAVEILFLPLQKDEIFLMLMIVQFPSVAYPSISQNQKYHSENVTNRCFKSEINN